MHVCKKNVFKLEYLRHINVRTVSNDNSAKYSSMKKVLKWSEFLFGAFKNNGISSHLLRLSDWRWLPIKNSETAWIESREALATRLAIKQCTI